MRKSKETCISQLNKKNVLKFPHKLSRIPYSFRIEIGMFSIEFVQYSFRI